MSTDDQQFRENAILLLNRERELFAMRTKHEQVTLWLRLTQLLPSLFDRTLPLAEIYARLRKSLISGLRLQSVLFFELAPAVLRPIAPAGPERALPLAVAAFLEQHPTGICNGPVGDLGQLADAVGLHRFIWSEVRVAGTLPVLLLAGYDKRTAPFQRLFDDSDAAHIENVAQHVETLMGNVSLLQELEREKHRLQQTNENLESRDRELLRASDQLRAANDSLERRVVERTEALNQRTLDMRLVLDNVDQGFLTIDAEGRLAQERSGIVDRWFGPFDGQPRFVDYIGPVDNQFADVFGVAYEALLEEFLPRELCLDQLPSRLRSQDRLFSCTYTLLPRGDAIAGLLIVISDVSAQVRRAQVEAEQTELLALFQGLTRDRSGYLAFLEEVGEIIDRLCAGPFDVALTRRLLHTLKGTAAMAGATEIARLCHKTEDALDEDENESPRADLDRLSQRWSTVRQELTSIVGEGARGVIEVSRDELQTLIDEIGRGVSPAHLLARLASWQSEPVVLPLNRLAQYARALARRIGKGDLAVNVAPCDVCLDPRRWGGLWSSLIQVVRNAVDHGIETPADRESSGKPPGGRLALRVRGTEQSGLIIELEDDGRGIDWDVVRSVAARRGLPAQDREDLEKAMFSPGFSTRSAVTATSGRGVGLAVVLERVQALGGRISVVSDKGVGCCWRLSFPGIAPSSADPPRIAPWAATV
jgi:HPt (histidine-containing phosphotransfer) domain-containing protein